MREKLKILLEQLKITSSMLFTFRPKVYFLGGTVNRNLGDNAQLVCIRDWIRDNYPKHRLIEISVAAGACHVAEVDSFLFSALVAYAWLTVMRLCQRKGDIVIANSGYNFIDHHSCWLLYARVAVACRKTPMVILPQTVNFLNGWIEAMARNAFKKNPHVLFLCRDFVSLEKTKAAFPSCRILPFPDIVTSWIGTRTYANARDGIMFCLRRDRAAFYTPEQLDALMRRFSDKRTECVNTTIPVTFSEMDQQREHLINAFLEHMSTFEVVVTDRYHGVIFALVTQTPVVVIDSCDHKLSSGVKWYPESFSEYIQFARTLDEAHDIALKFLSNPRKREPLPKLFKEQYYDTLRDRIDETVSA